ncbi:helix-turn-helix domain-containing protein [Oceanicella sp. SM1341]|uniref:winged helix-turn-helix transcriptional regulator n=1 Tax=Oceanicella sp. SM1341 TaxID=1548889 RepID=UPI000E53C36C|nr:helix-turn-helix domain-containing protein [Oceanicella sp. SM1341]
MTKDPAQSQPTCPIARALTHVGDAWSLLILRDAGLGLTRFEQFRQSLGIAPNILSRRLAALTEAGLLERRAYSEHPPRFEYLLTEMGRDFGPVLHAIGAWGRRHGGPAPLSVPVDAETGVPVEPVVVDGPTGRPIGSFPIRLRQP